MKFPSLPSKFILAPMAGVTDIAFRELCVDCGAAMTFTELVSSEALTRGIKRVSQKANRSPKEKVFGIQVFGSTPRSVRRAALAIQNSCDVVDLNLGCPAWSVRSQGCGSMLLKSPEKIEEILKDVLRVLKKPFTIKIRSGFSNRFNFLKIAKMAESLGVAAITLHPRTAKQRFSGKANWAHIKQLKEAVSIPVIGNGDVFTPEDGIRMLKETGCDYVMIGRAARSNPLIFKQSNDLLTKGKYKPASSEDKIKLFLKYTKLAKKYDVNFERVRAHAIQIVSGFDGSKEFRVKAASAESVEELISLLPKS